MTRSRRALSPVERPAVARPPVKKPPVRGPQTDRPQADRPQADRPPAALPPVALPPVAPRPEPAPRSERVNQIVAAARQILETEGEQALTMRRLGDELGIKAPSLYKHLPGRDAVVAHLVDQTLFETGERMHSVVSAPNTDGPVVALLAAYRDFGRNHPNLYRLITTGNLPRSALTPGLEDWAGEPFYRATADPFRAQALWAFAHGTLILEIDGRFLPGSDLARTWQAGAHAFTPGRGTE